MGPTLTAYILIIASIGMGSIVCYFSFGAKIVFKVAVAWAIITTAAMFTNMLLVIAVAVAIFLSVKDESNEVKILYFVALLPVLPLDPYILPFPGLNYLWNPNFTRVLVLLFLLPAFVLFVNKMSQEGALLRLSDLFFLAFFVLNLLIMVRLGSPTNIARAMFTILVDYGIPYFVVSRFLLTPMALNWLLCLFLIGASFLTFVSIFESIFGWRMYGQILLALNLQYDALTMVPYARDGTVRASGGAILQPLAYAYFASLAIVVTLFMWRQKLLNFFPAMMLMGLFFVGMMLTGSRGGLLSLMVGIFMLYYMKFSPNLKLLATVVGGILVVVMIGYFSAFGFSAVDSQGTFDYRVQLIQNSLDAVRANWLIGSNTYLHNAQLQQSIQGEGIIDVVNMYLQVTLEMGILGLFFFVGTFVVIIRDVWVKRPVNGFDHKDLLISLLVMTMVFIGTCSNVSYIPWYLFLFLAVSRAYTGFAEYYPRPVVHANQLLRKQKGTEKQA